MDHLSKEDTEETITSWSKQCLFSHREIVVDKAKLYCSFVPWSGQDIKKQCFLTSLRRSGAWKTFPFFKKTTKTFKGKKNARSFAVVESTQIKEYWEFLRLQLTYKKLKADKF